MEPPRWRTGSERRACVELRAGHFKPPLDVVEAKAAELVEAGYAVLIGDFYGPETPEDGDAAFAAMSRLRSDPVAMRQRLRMYMPEAVPTLMSCRCKRVRTNPPSSHAPTAWRSGPSAYLSSELTPPRHPLLAAR